MQFKTTGLPYSSRARTAASGAEPWAAAKLRRVGGQKKGRVIYGRRGLALPATGIGCCA